MLLRLRLRRRLLGVGVVWVMVKRVMRRRMWTMSAAMWGRRTRTAVLLLLVGGMTAGRAAASDRVPFWDRGGIDRRRHVCGGRGSDAEMGPRH